MSAREPIHFDVGGVGFGREPVHFDSTGSIPQREPIHFGSQFDAEPEAKKLGWLDVPGQVAHNLKAGATGIPAIVTQLFTTPDEFVADMRKSVFHVADTFSLIPRQTWAALSGDEEEEKRLHELLRQRFFDDPLTYALVGAGTAKGIGTRMAAMQALKRGEHRAITRRIPEIDLRAQGPVYTPRSVARAAILGWDPKLPEGTKRDVISVRLGKDIPGVGIAGTELSARTLPRNSYRADQAIVVDRALKALPPHFPLFGENARVARALRGKTRVPYLALMTEPIFADADKAWRDMNRKEQTAYNLHRILPDPADYAQHIANMKTKGTPAALVTAATMEDPAIRALHLEPSDRMRTYNQFGPALDELRQRILIESGAATPVERPVAAGMTRLYRAHGDDPVGETIPSWMRTDPTYRASAAATGRWFAGDREGAQWYLDNERPGGELHYVDVPTELAEAHRVSRLGGQAAQYSARPDEEFFLPSDIAAELRPVSENLHVPEFESSPYRQTQLVRGGRYLTNSLANRYLRKTDASIAAANRKKGKLVNEADRFGTNDMVEVTRQTRTASNALIRESGLRGRIFSRSQSGEDKAKSLGGQPEGSVLTSLDDISRAVDEARERVEADNALLDPAMGGVIDSNTLADLGLTMPEGGWPAGKVAYEQAVWRAAHKIESDEEKRLAAALKRAEDGVSSAKELAQLGITIPSDLRVPTAEEQARATALRVQAGKIKDRLKEAKRFRLSAEEQTRMRATIEKLSQQARDLETTRPIKRSASTLRKRQNSRYGKAQKILRKELGKQRKRIADMGEPPTGPADRRGDLHQQVLSALQRKMERDVDQHERLFAAEHALRESLERTAETSAQIKGIAKAKSDLHERKATYIAGTRMRMRETIEHRQDLIALRNEIDSMRGQIIGGGDAADLRAEFAAARTPAGKPRLTPHYAPDTLAVDKPSRLSRAEGSIAPPRPGADIFPSRSILFRTGQLALHPDTLGPAYFAAAKHSLNTDMHKIALAVSTRILKGQSPPKGWEFLRATRGEKISETEKHGGAHLRAAGQEYVRSEDLTTTDHNDPNLQETEIEGRRYRHIVPTGFANEFRQERVNSNKFQRYFLEKPMDVWRTLLLHLRVPWLVNNILGNSFLYGIRFAGTGGLASVARFYAEDAKTRGYIPAMKRLASYTLDPETFAKVFPGQARGTFLENAATGEMPEWFRNLVPPKARDFVDENRTARKVVKGAQLIPTGLPRVDKHYERYLRRKATVRVLRGSDEVRDAYATISKQGGDPSFAAAVQKALDGDPNFADYVMKEVNAGLGDFLSLSKVERGYIRQLVPFYAWMREIARISGRLVVDKPLRVAVLTQMAQAASEIQAQEVPEYMRGTVLNEKAGWIGALANMIPGLGGEGGTPALALHAMSPYGTVTDTVRGLRAVNPRGGGNAYDRRELVGNLNPLVSAFLAAYDKPPSEPGHGLFVDMAEEFARSVPQVQAISPYESRLYPDRTRWDLIRKIVTGDPRVRFDPDVAAYQQLQGR